MGKVIRGARVWEGFLWHTLLEMAQRTQSWGKHNLLFLSCCSQEQLWMFKEWTFLDREEFPEASKVLWGDTLWYRITDWGRLTVSLYPLGNKMLIIFFTLFVLNFWCFHEYMHCIMDTITMLDIIYVPPIPRTNTSFLLNQSTFFVHVCVCLWVYIYIYMLVCVCV